ncbi:MAG: carbohydrate kinase [Planctomycetaceae bacterium]|jgi:fructokinase|nr:carbohydrate kinase [Planctomycetaceae bacterium]MDG2390831.1 carbohydrate kinase [Planctomycetaceae bacterium]
MHHRPLVIGLGELLWDCFADSRRPGGAPANVAFQANQLDCEGVVCSRIGQDPLGEELTAFLESQGVSSRTLQFDAKTPTGTVTVEMQEGNHPAYTIHKDVAWDAMEFTPDWQKLMRSASAICFGSLAQRGEPSHTTIQQCLAATSEECLIVYDVNLRQNYFSSTVLEESLRACRAVKLNHEELIVISQLLNTSAKESPFAREIQSRYGVELVIITRGENGCLLISADETIDVPGEKIIVADAVGAGDAFTAGLISALLKNWPLKTAGEFANSVGAKVASCSGAMPDLKEDFAELITRFQP